jgi:hypothetical protein
MVKLLISEVGDAVGEMVIVTVLVGVGVEIAVLVEVGLIVAEGVLVADTVGVEVGECTGVLV